jgi:hypothetical protein
VPDLFFSPLFASLSTGARVSFLFQIGRHAAALDHEAVDHAVKYVPS